MPNKWVVAAAVVLVALAGAAKDGKDNTFGFAWFDLKPGIVTPGDEIAVTAVLENTAAHIMGGIEVTLNVPPEITIKSMPTGAIQLRGKEAKWLSWRILAGKTGRFPIAVTAKSRAVQAKAVQSLSVIAVRDPKHEYEDIAGAWQPYPARTALQKGNSEPVSDFVSLPSASLKSNLFGITAHLPRNTDDEIPFAPAHVTDGDPATCWASRWWRIAVPRTPESIELDLGKAQRIGEVRFLPAWKNSGVPSAFTIALSEDGRRWQTVVDETDYQLQKAPDGDQLRVGALSWQKFTFAERPARYVRLESTRLNQGNTSFFCAPFEPFQLRIAELALFDAAGKAIPVGDAKIQASSRHNAWYNTPETIKKTWPLLAKSGVKLNRVNQWGDKLDWATVEKTKGTYRIAPDAERGIDASVKNGIDILLTLDYGNNVYQRIKDPIDFGPTWHFAHPFLQCAPTTPEAIRGFAGYCAFMARHFRGRVKYFEIWNEENGWFFDAWADTMKVTTARTYGRALAAVVKAVKEANPEAFVVFGGIAGCSLDYTRIALEEGAGASIDAYAFHPYGRPTPELACPGYLIQVGEKFEFKSKPAELITYEDEIAAFRKLVHKYNPKMEIWADEMNWFAPGEPAKPDLGDLSELTQAKYLARFFALNAWLGCRAVWWSLYNDNGVQEWALLRSSDMSPRAGYFSAGYVSTVLDDVRGVSDVGAVVVGGAPKDLTVKIFRNGRGELLVGLWRTSAADDGCQPVPVTIFLPGMHAESAELADTLYGYKQKATIRNEGKGCVLPDLLVGDWPIFVRIDSKR